MGFIRLDLPSPLKSNCYLSIPFMGFILQKIEKCINEDKLSIPFMGFIPTNKSSHLMHDIFQFPLWDSEWDIVCFLNSHSIFQFPLWDSTAIFIHLAFETALSIPFMGFKLILPLRGEYDLFFQFPLWDSALLKQELNSSNITFNSLYGILIVLATALLIPVVLSIPFMGFYNPVVC